MSGDDKKKIGSVSGTERARGIDPTKAVGNVTAVAPTSTIGGVTGASRRKTRVMSLAEREELFKIVNEEAEKLFGKEGNKSSQAAVAREAVKMAIDSGLVAEKPKK